MGELVTLEEIMNLLRVQRHDFLNHLQVIMGLLQLNKPDRALAYIRQTSDKLLDEGRLSRLPSAELAAILILAGKQAEQKQVSLRIDMMDLTGIDGAKAARCLHRLVPAVIELSQPDSEICLRLAADGCRLEWPADQDRLPEAVQALGVPVDWAVSDGVYVVKGMFADA